MADPNIELFAQVVEALGDEDPTVDAYEWRRRAEMVQVLHTGRVRDRGG